MLKWLIPGQVALFQHCARPLGTDCDKEGENINPEVQRQFPEDYSDQEVLQTLTKFCFPFYMDSLTVSQVGQNFTFVLTDIDSKQRFGFCRLSSGAKSCFCILSYLPWFEVFYKLLNILADYTTKRQENQWNELLETLHKLPIPDPGVSVHLSVHSYFTVPDTRELPSIPENRNLTEYFVAVDVNNMLHLYASMLYERRILIICSKLSTLTACIHGSAAMLYPMYWQHVYIPVLPPHLLDYCCAPMPYLIGIHLSLMEKVRNMALDDVVILNVDTNTLETPFDDLQSLPNDVISSLKNRLKKVSTTTGDGVARAFLKAQAAFFGSYRNALKIEPKGSGAILNTVKTKANPAMKTVYKFAKDHAKMGIKEVKNRLKQKDIAENGCAPTPEEQLPKTAPSPLVEAKDPKLREDRRPITVHFGQVRPPRPHVVKRPKSNITVEGRRTSVPSPEQPQPYRTLKESDSAEGDEAESPEQRVRKPVGPVPAPPDRAASIDLLEDVFSNLDMEAPLQPLGQAKSLEDLRAPKDLREHPGTFDYQRLDLGGSERSRGMAVALKLAHPYNKLWSLGQDDMAIPSKPPASSPEKPLALLGNSLALPQRPQNQDSILNPSDKEEVPTPTLGSITIPRPQGRKTPELGIVPPPPVARPAKLQAAGTELGDFSEQLQMDRDRRAALSPALFPGLLPGVVPQGPTELLQPLSPGPRAAGTSSDALLALLDPLSTAWSGSTLPLRHTAPNVATPFTPQFSFPPAGTPTPFPQPPLNPFVPSMPAAPPTLPLVSTPAGPFGAPPASLGPAFASGLLLSSTGFCVPHRSQPNLSALSMPNLFGQMPMGTHTSPLQPLGPPAVAPSRIRTLPLARSSARAAEAKQGLALRPGDPPLLPPRPPQGLEPALQPSVPQQARDPFEDLLLKTKQDVSPSPAPAPAPGSVEQLRKQWETFE
ncbi:DENN domain-containing protein 1A isoform X19 [Callithrix jacchus]